MSQVWPWAVWSTKVWRISHLWCGPVLEDGKWGDWGTKWHRFPHQWIRRIGDLGIGKARARFEALAPLWLERAQRRRVNHATPEEKRTMRHRWYFSGNDNADGCLVCWTTTWAGPLPPEGPGRSPFALPYGPALWSRRPSPWPGWLHRVLVQMSHKLVIEVQQ
jgi:hypothetical protein